MSACLEQLREVVREDRPLVDCGELEVSNTALSGGDEFTQIDLIVEAIHEGYLLHYEEGRVLKPSDSDLALLAGDRLYALGLTRLAEIGDLDAVTRLADRISAAAQAQAEERIDDARRLWQ